VLESLRDAALLGIQVMVLRGHTIENSAQMLGLPSTAYQPIGHQRGSKRDRHTHNGDDPGQILEERAAQGASRGDHEREHAVTERNSDRRSTPGDRELMQTCHQKVTHPL
jgi:hypothetical protein